MSSDENTNVTYMKYIPVDVRIRQVRVYSNQIDSWMIGGQIRIIVRSIIENSTFFYSFNKPEYVLIVINKKNKISLCF